MSKPRMGETYIGTFRGWTPCQHALSYDDGSADPSVLAALTEHFRANYDEVDAIVPEIAAEDVIRFLASWVKDATKPMWSR